MSYDIVYNNIQLLIINLFLLNIIIIDDLVQSQQPNRLLVECEFSLNIIYEIGNWASLNLDL